LRGVAGAEGGGGLNSQLATPNSQTE